MNRAAPAPREPGLAPAAARSPARSYGALAWCYDELAALYGLGGIGRARRAGIDGLAPGERALFAGVGRGADAVEAARRGARVVGVDVSRAMLARCARRARRVGVELELHREDLRAHRPSVPYDAVFAPFVLNVFSEEEARRVLARLAGLVRPGGRIVVSDFAPPSGSWPARLFCRAAYGALDAGAWLLGLAPLHPIYDVRTWLAELGSGPVSTRTFGIGRRGPRHFACWEARRAGA